MKKEGMIRLIILGVVVITLVVVSIQYFSLKKSYDDYAREYNSDTIRESVWDQSILPIKTNINLSYYYLSNYSQETRWRIEGENPENYYGEDLTEKEINELKIFDGKEGDYYCYRYYPNYDCAGATWWYVEGTYEITKKEKVTIKDCQSLWNLKLFSDHEANSRVHVNFSLYECKNGLYFRESLDASGKPAPKSDTLILLDKYDSEPAVREALGI